MNLTVGVVAVLLLTVQVFCSFNCNRDTSQCAHDSTCNQGASNCVCLSGYSGYDCGITDSDVGNGTCTSTYCENGGTCQQAGGDPEPSCHCPVEYIGANCSSLRYNLECTADNMTLSITPFVPNFVGSVFVVDQAGKSTCTATDEGNGVQGITVNHVDATCTDATFDAASGTYTRCFYIIYNNKTFTTYDQKLCAVCGGGDTIVKTTGNVTITDLDPNLDERTIGNAPLDTDVGMKLMSNDAEVTGPVSLGAILEIGVYLTSTGAERFQAIQVISCKATNAKAESDAQYSSGMLLENYCPSSDLSIVLMDDLNRTMDNYNVSFAFSAFKFIYGDIVSIACTIKACKLTGDCAATLCSVGENPPIGVGRRKRQAEETEDKVLTKSYQIGLPQTDQGDQTSVTKEDIKACYQTWEMTATVVALAIALFLVLLLCVILIIRTILSRKTKTVYTQDSSCGTPNPSFAHLPKLVSDKTC